MKRLSTLIFAVLLVLAPFVPGRVDAAQGRFWFRCTFSHRLQDDPIVNPGLPGGADHLHDFFGNKTTNAFSTYENMVGQQTSCNVSLNSAGYWSPALLVNDQPVNIVNVAVYYWGVVGQTVAFPPNFKLIAGAYDGRVTGTGGVYQLGWDCVGGVPISPSPVNCGTKNVKMHVTFPDCWDGVNLDSANHRSHMAFPVSGKCPGSHPVRVPRLEFHVTYGLKDGTQAVLASDHGATPGTTLHADYWNTWNQAELERLVAECINLDQPCNDLHI